MTKKGESNRKNAQQSTGPRDTSVTRFNATRHGLLATCVTPLDHETYEAVLESLQAELVPQGTIENILVERLALYSVRLRRSATMQSEYIGGAMKPKPRIVTPKRRRSPLEMFLVGEPGDEEKELRGALKDLLPTMLQLTAEDTGAASVDINRLRLTLDRLATALEPPPPEELATSQPLDLGFIEVLDQKLQRYETTLENRFFRTMHELERLQRLRAGDPVPAPLTLDVAVHTSADAAA